MAKTRKKNRAPALAVPHMSVVALIILCILTCNVYMMIWFVQRRSFLNSLRPAKPIRAWVPAAAAICFGVGNLLSIIGRVSEDSGMDTAGSLVLAFSSIFILFMAFRAKSILEQHLSRIPGTSWADYRLSGLATFFFSIYYLQYRINSLPESTDDIAQHFD